MLRISLNAKSVSSKTDASPFKPKCWFQDSNRQCRSFYFEKKEPETSVGKQIQSCMIFTEKIVVAKVSVKAMHSGKVKQFIY